MENAKENTQVQNNSTNFLDYFQFAPFSNNLFQKDISTQRVINLLWKAH